MFINGKEYPPVSVTGDSAVAVTSKATRYTAAFSPESNTTEIDMYYSNFVHSDMGGFYRITLGSAQNIIRGEQLKALRITAVTFALLTAMLFFFGMFLLYSAATPDEAAKFLALMPPRAFGLAEPYDDYEVLFVEEASVEGSDCYRMELHVTYPDGIEVLTLFIRTDLGVMYHYDDESGGYHEVTPYDYYCPQESPKCDNSGAQD